MYKRAIDILTAKDVDLAAIAIEVAKSSPSVFVKAHKALSGECVNEQPEECTPLESFTRNSVEAVRSSLKLDDFAFNSIVREYGMRVWLPEVLTFLFGMGDSPHTIKAIKIIRAHDDLGLRDSKHVVDGILKGNFAKDVYL